MRHSKKIAALAVASIVLMIGGVASALWTSTATGSGTAKSFADGTDLNKIAGVDGVAGLYPGATQSVSIEVTNPHPYPVRVTAIGAGTSAAVGETGDVCAAGAVTTAAVSNPVDTIIAVGEKGTYSLTATMGDVGNVCKNRTFTITGLTASLASAAS